jgi:hypothetical protein
MLALRTVDPASAARESECSPLRCTQPTVLLADQATCGGGVVAGRCALLGMLIRLGSARGGEPVS